jgi:hypothetical protein
VNRHSFCFGHRGKAFEQSRAKADDRQTDHFMLLGVVAEDHTFADVHALCRMRGTKGQV